MAIHGRRPQEKRVQILPELVQLKYFLSLSQRLFPMENSGIFHLKHRGIDSKIQTGFKLGMMTVYPYPKNMILSFQRI